MVEARDELGISKFVPHKRGSKLYKKTMSIFVHRHGGSAEPKPARAAGSTVVGGKNVWVRAVAAARRHLNVDGFVPLKKGEPLYERAMDLKRVATLRGGAARIPSRLPARLPTASALTRPSSRTAGAAMAVRAKPKSKKAGGANMWAQAVSAARQDLKVGPAFVPLRKHEPLYNRAKQIHTAWQASN
jgi:hypothetical protein